MTNGSYDKKFQVFVSSTYKDLIEERQKIVEGILESKNFPAGMELFTASNDDQWHIIEKWIDESDIVILLIGSRYGSIPQGEEKSYTHKEYDYAKEKKKIVLTFIMSESHMYGKVASGAYKSQDIQENVNKEKFEKFKRNLLDSSLCKVNIKNIDQLKTDVILSIQNETRGLAGGWIREKDIQSISTVENESNLKRKNEKDFELYTNLLPKLKELYKTNTYLTNNFNAYSQKTLNDLFQFLYQNSIHNDPSQKFIDNNLNESLNNMYDKSSNIYDIFISNKHDSINYKGVSSLELNGEKLGHPDKVQELVDSIFENYSSFKESYLNFIDYTNEKFYK